MKKNTTKPSPGEELRRRLDEVEAEIREQAAALREEYRDLHERRDEIADAAETAAARPRIIRHQWSSLDESATAMDYVLATAEAERAAVFHEGVHKRLETIEKDMPLETSETATAVAPVLEDLTGGAVEVVETFAPIAKAEAIAKEVVREHGGLLIVVAQETDVVGSNVNEFNKVQAKRAAQGGLLQGKVHVRYVNRKPPYAPLSSAAVIKAAQDRSMDFGTAANVAEDKFTLNVARAHVTVPRVRLAGTSETLAWSKTLAGIVASSVGYNNGSVQLTSRGGYTSSHLLTRPDGGQCLGAEFDNHERLTTVQAKVAVRPLKPIEGGGGLSVRVKRTLDDLVGTFVTGMGVVDSIAVSGNYVPGDLSDVSGVPQEANAILYSSDSGYVVDTVFRSRPLAGQ